MDKAHIQHVNTIISSKAHSRKRNIHDRITQSISTREQGLFRNHFLHWYHHEIQFQ